jgi:hypothetical protein
VQNEIKIQPGSIGVETCNRKPGRERDPKRLFLVGILAVRHRCKLNQLDDNLGAANVTLTAAELAEPDAETALSPVIPTGSSSASPTRSLRRPSRAKGESHVKATLRQGRHHHRRLA